MPGFPKALARTLHELRLAGVPRRTSTRPATARPRPADADLFHAARPRRGGTGAIRRGRSRRAVSSGGGGLPRRAGAMGQPADPAARRAARLARRAGVRRGADRAVARRARHRARRRRRSRSTPRRRSAEQSSAGEFRLRSQSSGSAGFRPGVSAPLRVSDRAAAERERAGDVVLFSAPGEGREAVEIVRRVLDEAGRGVPFDEMAVFLRTPQQYLGLARARVRARRRAGLFRSRHAAARSRRPRVRRAAVVRGRRAVGQALRRVSVARPGAAGRGERPRQQTLVVAARRGVRRRGAPRSSR